MEKTEKNIERAIKGDKSAFRKLYDISKNQVYFTCLGILKNKNDAEDITQEVYMTVFKKLSSLSDKNSFHSWINRIAVTKSFNLLKKRQYLSLDENLEKYEYNIADEELVLPDEYIVNKSKRKIIMDIIMNKLSEVQRQTIILYYFDEFSTQEISEIMNCPLGTVTYRLSSARKVIKSEVLEYEKNNGDKLHMLIPFSIGECLNNISKDIVVDAKIVSSLGISGISGISKAFFTSSAFKVAVAVISVPTIAFGTFAVINNDSNKLKTEFNKVPSAKNYDIPVVNNIEDDNNIPAVTEITTVADVNISLSTTVITAKDLETTTIMTTSTTTANTIITINETDIVNDFEEIEVTENIEIIPEETITTTITSEDISEITTETVIVTEPISENTDIKNYDDILLKINDYQDEYFNTNLMFGDVTSIDYNITEIEKNIQELSNIIGSEISEDNIYYQRYLNIDDELNENHFGYPEDAYVGGAQVQMRRYDEFENLYNEIYEYIENNTSEEDFEKIKISEEKWIENKENCCQSVMPNFIKNGWSIPTYGQFQADTIKFRCLLMILYI